ncbi:MAG: type IV secretion system DNA-binding domain-containing protein [Armatimonadetes bacterium]|nr:type IV secretion system DNA-binding domain-containing protein [Armatimonadota bacterium]
MNYLQKLVETAAITALNSRIPATTASGLPGDTLGFGLETGEPFTLSDRDLARHVYLLGATGSGKTTLILRLIENDLKENHSVVVIDLRGDLVQRVLGICAKLRLSPDRVTLLDLRETQKIQGFNPLSGAGEPYIRALHLLEIVEAESSSWGVQLEETLRNALLLLASSDWTLAEIELVLFDPAFRNSALLKCDDPGVTSFWHRYDLLSPEKQQAWALPVLNKVTPLLSVPTLRSVLGSKDALNLELELNTPGAVLLVSLAVDELHRSARMLGSLVVAAISREMMARVNVPEPQRVPVRVYVDEFENMASQSFETLIAEGRRFGLTLVLSHQTLAQLAPKLRSVIRNNVGIQVLFQVGFEDAGTLARELPDGITASELRELEVGQAYVMARDGATQLVHFSPSSIPSSRLLVSSYRKALLARIPCRLSHKVGSTPTVVSPLDLEDWS